MICRVVYFVTRFLKKINVFSLVRFHGNFFFNFFMQGIVEPWFIFMSPNNSFYGIHSLTCIKINVFEKFRRAWSIFSALSIVTCRGSEYLSALHSGSGLRSSRPQRAQCASKYTDMRNVFTMIYLTVGYLGALQYIQCATTMVCLTSRWTMTTRG